MLRVIRQHRWDSPGKCDWLAQGDIPADPLADFANTSGNCLSVWLVDDEKKGLERLLAGLAATREKADKLDYVLFSQDVVEAESMELRQTGGATPDEHVNERHGDLTRLSAAKVLALTERVWHEHLELKRMDRRAVLQLVAEGVRDGRILTSRLRPKLLEDVRRYLDDKGGALQKPK